MKHCLLALFAMVLLLCCSDCAAAEPASKEYQLKAAFLYNFAQFVQWPPNAFASAESPFSIGILGDDPFGRALEETIRGESIQGHKMMVRRARRVEELQNCQIVFVTRAEHGRINEILSRLGGGGILTVGETPGFASRGGVINFYLEGNKVRFEINPAAAQREGLKISSQLLSLGKIVEPELSKGGQ